MSMRWLIAAAATGLMLTAPVFGHARLRSSSPPADVSLAAAPKTLVLTYSESVRLAVLTLSTDGKNIPLTIDRDAPAALQITVALPALAAGKYQVRWSALSAADGHATHGTFSFSIQPAARSSAPP